jgi:hypothetical protein
MESKVGHEGSACFKKEVLSVSSSGKEELIHLEFKKQQEQTVSTFGRPLPLLPIE